jgi:hypothetical protein
LRNHGLPILRGASKISVGSFPDVRTSKDRQNEWIGCHERVCDRATTDEAPPPPQLLARR